MEPQIIEAEIEPLTMVERNNLQYHEQRIEAGKKSMIEMAESLREIKEGRLYRHQYKTFEQYCSERWRFTGRYAVQLLEAETVLKELNEDMKCTSGISVSSAAELSRIKREDRPAVIEIYREISGTGERHPMRTAINSFKENTEVAPNIPQPTVAMQQAARAIAALTDIPHDDAMLQDAMHKVISYCRSRL